MTNRNKLHIAIIGPAASGKTALAQLIQDTLYAHGITNVTIEDEDTRPDLLIAHKVARITALRQRNPEVVISQASDVLVDTDEPTHAQVIDGTVVQTLTEAEAVEAEQVAPGTVVEIVQVTTKNEPAKE
jgi:ABC-type branched-subunit amino acid transport system ATPase component